MIERAINLVGERFGRFVVVRRDGLYGRNAAWLCLCDCGESARVASNSLKRGSTKSCGCLQRELTARNKTIHGHAKRSEPSQTYNSWQGMIARCTNPNASNYEYYGGRGIEVCQRWLDNFENFLTDMGERPEGKSIDRENVNGNYEPSNCRWATCEQQASNKRSK